MEVQTASACALLLFEPYLILVQSQKACTLLTTNLLRKLHSTSVSQELEKPPWMMVSDTNCFSCRGQNSCKGSKHVPANHLRDQRLEEAGNMTDRSQGDNLGNLAEGPLLEVGLRISSDQDDHAEASFHKWSCDDFRIWAIRLLE